MLVQFIITAGFFAAAVFAIQVNVPVRNRNPI
jgi:hypothetical protein